MVADGEMYCLKLQGFWMDIGQPKDYLNGMSLYLNWLQTRDPEKLSTRLDVVGNVIVVSQ